MGNPFWQTVIVLIGCSGAWTAAVEIVKAITGRKTHIAKSIDDLKADMVALNENLKAEEKRRAEDKMEMTRFNIVEFNDELLNGTAHSKSMFDTILLSCKQYERFCKENPDFENGVAVEAILNIRRVYRKREERKDFL